MIQWKFYETAEEMTNSYDYIERFQEKAKEAT
jgi:hypothetical protein